MLSAEADEFDSVGIIVQRVFAKREFHVHHRESSVVGWNGQKERELEAGQLDTHRSTTTPYTIKNDLQAYRLLK